MSMMTVAAPLLFPLPPPLPLQPFICEVCGAPSAMGQGTQSLHLVAFVFGGGTRVDSHSEVEGPGFYAFIGLRN